jgi:hypothetical protein
MGLIARPPKSSLIGSTTSVQGWRAPGTYGNPGSGTPVLQSTNSYYLHSKQYADMQGWTHSEYWTKLKAGKLLPMTPWIQYSYNYVVTDSKFDVKQFTTAPYYRYYTSPAHSYAWTISTDKDPWIVGPTVLESNVDFDDLGFYVQSAAAKIYSSGWDALTFGSELSKTVAMFRGFVSRLITLIRTGKFADLWLEGRYGWRTLVYDMKDIAEAIVNLNEGRKRFRESAGQTDQHQSVVDYTKTFVWGTLTNTVSATTTVGVRGVVVAEIEPPRFIFNPIITGWELTRLSFVVDWVLNVGKFLESLSFLTLQRDYVSAGGLQVKNEWTMTSSYTGSSGFTGDWKYVTAGTETLTRRYPMPVSKLPLLKLQLDAYKVFDLVALFTQALRK